MGLAVGIDLGTTNTVVGAVRDGVAAPLADPQGQRLIPSVVSFHPSGTTLVGNPARGRRLVDPINTIYSVKRLIGRTWSTPEVQRAKASLPFELREGPNASCLVVARGQSYTLPEISAFVLRHAKAVAEAAVGEPVDRAVITVPANFNDLQRAATKTAGRLVGLEVLRILNEPTAAALAYGPSGKARERVAVYDLGGGTFDVTVLDLAGNVFEVIATAGDSALGGDDIDLVIAERMADDLLKKHRYDARADPAAFGRVRMLAEALKLALSSADEHTLAVDDLVPGERGKAVSWRFRMTRPELEWASLALVERTFKVCQQALEASGTTTAELDRVILVGGATRMPMVARKVEQFFAKLPTVRINPDEVVALGAAIQAALLDRARRATPGGGEHPRIAEDSIVEPLPHEEAASARDVEGVLPVVTARKGAIANQAAAPPGAAPGGPTPGQFLPGSGGRALVFDTTPEPSTAMPAGSVSALEVEPPRPPPLPAAQHRVEEVAAAAPLVTPTVTGAAPPPVRVRQATVRYELELAERKFAPAAKASEAPATVVTPAMPEPEAVAEAEPISLPPPEPEGAFAPSFPPMPATDLGATPTPVHSFQPATVPAFTPMLRRSAPDTAFTPGPTPTLTHAPAPAPRPPRPAPLLIDVTPLSLGVETAGGYCDVLIDANTPVPCDRTRTFSPARDGQTRVQVRVAQGQSLRFDENTCLGELELSELAAGVRGEQRIAVTFEIDADGILNVRARDVATGREATAHLQLLGANESPAELAAMAQRQAEHPIAPVR